MRTNVLVGSNPNPGKRFSEVESNRIDLIRSDPRNSRVAMKIRMLGIRSARLEIKMVIHKVILQCVKK